MSSSLTRLELVQTAVAQAGRGAELYAHAKTLLNIMLKSWALKAKYPILRKIGSPLTLAAGSSTVTLPTDFGAGSDHLLFGTENTYIPETPFDQFMLQGMYPRSDMANARPTAFTVDLAGSRFQFNSPADAAYSLIPVYYYKPDDIPLTGAGDSQKVWFNDDEAVIQGLIEMVYQFKGDEREMAQGAKAEKRVADHRRGSTPSSGVLKLSPRVFK